MLRRPTLGTVVALALVGSLAAGCGQGGGDDMALERASVRSTTTSTTRPPRPTTTTTAPPATSTTTAPPVDVFAMTPPSAPADPAALATRLAAAEDAIRGSDGTEADLARAALEQQVLYRTLGAHPEWDEAVLAGLPEALRPSVQLHAAARREFRGMHTTLSPNLPAWEIVRPAPHDELLRSYQEAEATFGIAWQYLAAINLVETATGRIRGTSTSGAQGPMQFMPATWAAYGGGGDINDTHDAIMGAARYLAANNGAVDIDNALYRYNHSDRYVRGVKLYAQLLTEHPRTARALYYWGVWYLSDQGDVYLPVGYRETRPVPVADYRARS